MWGFAVKIRGVVSKFSQSEMTSPPLNTLNPNPTILGGSDPGILVIFENRTVELRLEF